MAVNKVDLSNGENLIDLTSDTVTPSTLVKGVTAHNSKGEKIIGNLNPEGGGSGGGGIIDVTELPTENIDENAVYRVTESYTAGSNDLYMVKEGMFMTVSDYWVSMVGIPPNIYYVDKLPNDMLETDFTNYSAANIYVVESSGIGYIFAFQSVMSLGKTLFGDESYDKGISDDIISETEDGVYYTVAQSGSVIKYFTRENEEWAEITAHIYQVLPNGASKFTPLFGNYEVEEIEVTQTGTVVDIITMINNDKVIPSKIKVNTPSTADLISGDITEITKDYFLRADGSYVTSLISYSLAGKLFEKIELPAELTHIYDNAFYMCTRLQSIEFGESLTFIDYYAFKYCSRLQRVTFRGKPNGIDTSAFENCTALTTINVPWSEGEVAGAPWGATNATINYNYTGE